MQGIAGLFISTKYQTDSSKVQNLGEVDLKITVGLPGEQTLTAKIGAPSFHKFFKIRRVR